MTEVVRRVPRLRPAVMAALVTASVGIFLGDRVVLLGVIVPVTYVVYDLFTDAPSPTVEVERRMPEEITPGETEEVELRVTNSGDGVLPDLRVVDGVPESVEVVEGSPSLYTSLRRGETVTISYSIAATRGVHSFTDVVVRSRSTSGTSEREVRVQIDSSVVSEYGISELPLLEEPVEFGGRVGTDRGGKGIEFYSTRRYHPSDSMNQIDWRRFAKTGELMTVEYRAQRGATAVILVDARMNYGVNAVPGTSFLDLVSYASIQALEEVMDYGVRVGVGVFDMSSFRWVEPGTSASHVAEVRSILNDLSGEDRETGLLDASALEEYVRSEGDGEEVVPEELLGRLPESTNVVYFTALLDGSSVGVVERLVPFGHHVSVISPSVTVGGGRDERLAGLKRKSVLEDLREAGVSVVDWSPNEPLAVAVSRSKEIRGGRSE